MSVGFRNVDGARTDPVVTWPYEALVAVIERGLIPDWQPIFAEIRRQPWGSVARRVERVIASPDIDAAGTLFRLAIERARSDADRADKLAIAEAVKAAIARSGLTADAFASRVGTSASRLSTYVNATVMPSAAMFVRIQRLGDYGPDDQTMI